MIAPAEDPEHSAGGRQRYRARDAGNCGTRTTGSARSCLVSGACPLPSADVTFGRYVPRAVRVWHAEPGRSATPARITTKEVTQR